MKYNEQKGDLFSLDSKYYLAHCISADFGMAAGIAVEFNKRFNMKNKLLKMWNGQTPDYPQALLVDNVFNLVTKAKYWNKPTYQTITDAIKDMAEICKQNNIKYLGMPVIGCGLDKLQWNKVREIIKESFKDLDIEIEVRFK